MAIITLTVTDSANQIISGIPESVTLTTDIPSTIFYTLDGTVPNINSNIAIGSTFLGSTGLGVTLTAYAVAGVDQSSIFVKTYSTVSLMDRTRNLNQEGINVLPPGSTSVASIGVDLLGNPAMQTSIPINDLDLRASTSDSSGRPIPGGSTLGFVTFPLRLPVFDPSIRSSTDQASFDPNAKVILVKGSTQQDRDNQIVKVYNRSAGTIDVTSDYYWNRPGEMDLVSGNWVRSIFNPKTGKMISYYFESRESRWLISEQQITPNPINMFGNTRQGPGFVFEWIDNRVMSKLF